MNRKLKQAAAFLTVAMPALVASANEGDRALARDEHIAFCAERVGKMADCREDFAAHFASKVPPESRAAQRARFIERMREVASDTIEARRSKCADSLDRTQAIVTRDDAATARRCFALADCKAAVACLGPLLERAPMKAPTR